MLSFIRKNNHCFFAAILIGAVLSSVIFIHLKNEYLKHQVNLKIRKIPKKERDILSKFFLRLIIFEGSAGYTLLGDKPVSVIGYLKEFPPGLISLKSTYWNSIALEGHKVWLRYKHLFSSKKFDLTHTPSSRRVQSIFLINKRACADTVAKHPDHFHEIEPVHEKITTGKFWSNLSQIQIGLFFGFGKKNAQAFERFQEIRKKAWNCIISLPNKDSRNINAIQKEDTRGLLRIARTTTPIPSLKPSQGFLSLGEEYSTLRGSKISREKYKPVWIAEKTFLPQFIVTSEEELEGSETDKLMKSYRETRKKLMKLSKSKHFLRDVLVEWMR